MSGTCPVRLASRSCANWSSDANGNLVTENYVGNITNYTFDTENRLAKVVQPSGYTEENKYSRDGLRRVRLAGTSTVTYLWDDHVLLRDDAIYTTLPGAPGGLLSAKVGGDHRFYVPDMQGHVRQVTDIDVDVVAEYQYDAWGLIQLTAATAMAFADWGYTWDGRPGRYYVQQRHLRADLGRWMSRDPVEGELPYAYVANRPTWAVDPSGEQFTPGGASPPFGYAINPPNRAPGATHPPDPQLQIRGWVPPPGWQVTAGSVGDTTEVPVGAPFLRRQFDPAVLRPTGPAWVIVVGGISNNDPDHDQSPWNFISAALVRVDEIHRIRPDAAVIVMVCMWPYEQRVRRQAAPAWQHRLTGRVAPYLQGTRDVSFFRRALQAYSGQHLFRLVPIEGSRGIADSLTRELISLGRSRVVAIDYFGHSTAPAWFLDYGVQDVGNPTPTGRWTIQHFRRLWQAGVLRQGAIVHSFGCNQANGPDPSSLMLQIYKETGLTTYGSEGTTSYLPTAHGRLPSSEKGYRYYR